MSGDDIPSTESEGSGGKMSRRGLLRNTAGLGAATVAAGLLVDALASPASAATAAPATAPNTSTAAAVPASAGEPMVAHVRDARTGEIDLFVGTRHIRFTDPAVAARLAQAAR
jgi:hypothetical protein